jgi:hypothetical protein
MHYPFRFLLAMVVQAENRVEQVGGNIVVHINFNCEHLFLHNCVQIYLFVCSKY